MIELFRPQQTLREQSKLVERHISNETQLNQVRIFKLVPNYRPSPSASVCSGILFQDKHWMVEGTQKCLDRNHHQIDLSRIRVAGGCKGWR